MNFANSFVASAAELFMRAMWYWISEDAIL